MPAWRDDHILELANQLTYSPAEKRREQLSAAIDLLPDIDPAKNYPWDFIYFRITAIQLRTHLDHSLTGKILRADLASLIEFLSGTLSLRIEDFAAGSPNSASPAESVLEFEQVSRNFNVSAKTIQRWRKQGLYALKFICPDGRRRLGFPASVVAQFAAANREKIERSAAFAPLSDEEKKQIITLARRMASQSPGHHPCSIKEISRIIARTLHRAPETIRYTLRRYDRDHPEAAIFSDSASPSRIPAPAAEPPAAPTPAAAPATAATCDPTQPSLFSDPPESASACAPGIPAAPLAPIEFIPNPLFDHPDAENIILRVLPAEALARAQSTVAAGSNAKSADVFISRIPRDLPPFLQEIFRQPVMPQELETDAFRRMNFLKHRAHQSQEQLSSAQSPPLPRGGRNVPEPGATALPQQTRAPSSAEEIEIPSDLLAQAAEIKNQILKSNLRVAVHVARKHARPGRPLMELVSDATLWLMRAIDTYDFARGSSQSTFAGSAPAHARFSTYAGYSIMKNFARARADQLTRPDSNLLTGQHELLAPSAIAPNPPPKPSTPPACNPICSPWSKNSPTVNASSSPDTSASAPPPNPSPSPRSATRWASPKPASVKSKPAPSSVSATSWKPAATNSKIRVAAAQRAGRREIPQPPPPRSPQSPPRGEAPTVNSGNRKVAVTNRQRSRAAKGPAQEKQKGISPCPTPPNCSSPSKA